MLVLDLNEKISRKIAVQDLVHQFPPHTHRMFLQKETIRVMIDQRALKQSSKANLLVLQSLRNFM